MSDQIQDLTEDVVSTYMAGFAARLYVGREPHQYQSQIQDAIPVLLDEHGKKVKVVSWNRMCGFFVGTPETVPPADKKSQLPEIGFNLMIKGKQQLEALIAAKRFPSDVAFPFEPSDNIIFVIHEFDGIMEEKQRNGTIVTQVRSYINANMATPVPKLDRDGAVIEGEIDRGKRMLVFLGTSADLGRYLPELTPNHVALPGPTATKKAIDAVFNPVVRQHKADKNKGMRELTGEEYKIIQDACQGMPYQEREDAVSKALTVHKDAIKAAKHIPDMQAFLSVIEEEKARYIRGMPGVKYISKMSLPTNDLPGYEPVNEFIDDIISLPPEFTLKHGLPSLKGTLVLGPPGTGKTELTKSIARKTSSMLLDVNPGELQGMHVGETEMKGRAFLDMVEQFGKVVVRIGELDKQGTTEASSGGGGNPSYGRLISMLLEFMTSPANQAIWVFDANNMVTAARPDVPLIPAPLIRAGRVDEKFFVELPDEVIRRNILAVIGKRYKIDFENKNAIADIAGVTDEFVGGELNDLIVRGVRHMGKNGGKRLDTKFLVERAARMAPVARNEAFKADLTANRNACRLFTLVGRSNAGQKVESIKLDGDHTAGRGERGDLLS